MFRLLHTSVLMRLGWAGQNPGKPATRCLRFGDSWSKEEKFAKYQKAVGKGLLNLASILLERLQALQALLDA